MPKVTEYSCKLRNPKRFQQKSFRRIQSGDVDLIIARPYGKTKTRAQAIRYPRELWDEKAARQSCRKRKGKFEPVRKPKLGITKPRYPYNPFDIVKSKGKWYVIGHIGGNHWIRISQGYRTKKDAVANITRKKKAAR